MLKFSAFKAPVRYVFVDPDRKAHLYKASNKDDLITQIRGYREQNRLKAIQNIDAVIDNFLCTLPENAGRCESLSLKRGWIQYLKGGIAFLENVFYGEKNMVDQQTAESRAQICVGCPHNVFPDKSNFVAWSDELALASTGGRTVPQQSELGNCEVCSCTLKAKVWYGGKILLTKKEREAMLKVGCWQPKEAIK